MRALVQRVSRARVETGGTVAGEIGGGLLVFLGVAGTDDEADAVGLAQRCAALRIFEDDNGRMNRSLSETGGRVLVVSQFTLYADTRKGNRPSFTDAADPATAERLYGEFIAEMGRLLGEGNVARGVFRAMMDVHLVNDGPVTILLESRKSR